MTSVVQRVKRGSVCIDGEVCATITQGMVVLAALTHSDDEAGVHKMAAKLAKLRIFEDHNGKMNRSILDIGGQMLLISNFTLAADCNSGHRPSFSNAMAPELAKELFAKFEAAVKEQGVCLQTGKFGANMQIELINDGPVTLIIDN